MKVLFAPDYRKPNSYQQNLGNSLEEAGVELSYVRARPLPFEIYRSCNKIRPDVLHLHWPEGMFTGIRRLRDFRPCLILGEAQYLLDLYFALKKHSIKLVVTAHNIWPHREWDSASTRYTISRTAQIADGIIAHSALAKQEIVEAWKVKEDKISVIPHGDLSGVFGEIPSPKEARKLLPIPQDLPMFLIFGVIEAYKAIDEVILAWKKLGLPARLVIIGFGRKKILRDLGEMAAGCPTIHFLPGARLSEDDFRIWLSAADGSVFNYKRTLTSGAASLARSLGIPVLIHRRASTIDLGEPNPAVFRYGTMEDEFRHAVQQVIALVEKRPPRDEEWLKRISWPTVATATLDFYRRVLA